MEQLEIQEKDVSWLTERFSIDREQALAVLSRSRGSRLDAVIALERGGVIPPVEGGSWSTRWGAPAEDTPETGERTKKRALPAGTRARSGRRAYTSAEVKEAVRSLLKNCLQVTIDVWREEDLLVGIPLIICILLFFVAPYAMIPLTIVGLMLRCRYHISGWDFGEETINRTMDQVTETVADWTDQVWNEVNDRRNKHRK